VVDHAAVMAAVILEMLAVRVENMVVAVVVPGALAQLLAVMVALEEFVLFGLEPAANSHQLALGHLNF